MKKTRLFALICAFTIMFSTSALAARTHRAMTGFVDQKINGYDIIFSGTLLVNDATGVYSTAGLTNLTADPNRNIPNGYLKLFTYLYNANGSLVEVASTPYTGAQFGPGNGPDIQTKIYTTPGDYYTAAEFWMYNPNTGNYDSYRVTNSPRLTYNPENVTVKISKIAYNNLDIMPQLIAAVGINGVEGFIKCEDLYGEIPSSPEVAVKVSNGDRYINLYADDGTSIIGQFFVEGS